MGLLLSSNVFILLPLLAWFLPNTEGTKVTYYYVAYEKDYPTGGKQTLASCSGTTLATTGTKFAQAIAVEGTGVLRNNNVLNFGSCISGSKQCKKVRGKYSCFDKVSAPLGSNGNALVPFVSIASNDMPFGTTGVVAEFKGKKLPNGETHDGCVRVDDTCSTCTTRDWIDFYILKQQSLRAVERGWAPSESHVRFSRQKCTPKRYNIR
jgi:hypothetical protein